MALSIPSIDQIIKGASSTINRFPLPILAGFMFSMLSVYGIEVIETDPLAYAWLMNAIFCSALGISWFLALDLLIESRTWTPPINWGVRLGGVLLLLAYYFSIEGMLVDDTYEALTRFGLLVLTSHLFVAIAAFLNESEMDQFWEFNKQLFLSILLSVVYTGVLFVGLTVALLSIDNLLGFDIKDKFYAQLWVCMLGIFNTLLFLSKVPKVEDVTTISYPKALKVFVQYVLIPLVTTYILILYMYLFKILIQWELPNGWVAYLVLSFSIAGILSLLLLYPIQEQKDQTWIKLYGRGFYFGLIPLSGLLVLSIWVRISEYGVTINRYLVATLAVWLIGLILYNLISHKKNIKVIPISLALIAFLVGWGPLGAFEVSERNQLGRLTAYLEEYDYLNDEGVAVDGDTEISFEDRKELTSITGYLIENHGLQSLQPLFNKEMNELVDSDYPYVQNEEILAHIGIEAVSRYETVELQSSKSFDYSAKNDEVIPVEGASYLIPAKLLNTNFPTEEIGAYILQLEDDRQSLKLRHTEEDWEVVFNLQETLDTLSRKGRSRSDLNPEELRMTMNAPNGQVSLMISSIGGTLNDNDYIINYINFSLLIYESP